MIISHVEMDLIMLPTEIPACGQQKATEQT